MKKMVLLGVLAMACGRAVVEQPPPTDGSTPSAVSHLPENRAVVIGNVVNLRQGPGTVYAVVGQVSRGDTLVVMGEAENWYRVYIPDRSLFAWVYSGLTEGADLP
jgi:uncharacterized protein YgiM (DUF1202 family)